MNPNEIAEIEKIITDGCQRIDLDFIYKNGLMNTKVNRMISKCDNCPLRKLKTVNLINTDYEECINFFSNLFSSSDDYFLVIKSTFLEEFEKIKFSTKLNYLDEI